MIVVTSIDLSPDAYRYFLRKAETLNITAEAFISSLLESFAKEQSQPSTPDISIWEKILPHPNP